MKSSTIKKIGLIICLILLIMMLSGNLLGGGAVNIIMIVLLAVVLISHFTGSEAKAKKEQKLKDKIECENKIREFDKASNGKAFCPQCGCTDVQYVSDTAVTRGKNRTGAGLATASLINPVAGIIVGSSHKKDNIQHAEYCVCLRCGYKWNPQKIKKILDE